MELRNGLAALICIVMIAAPWWSTDSAEQTAAITAVLIGIVQLFSALLARGRSGWHSWPNWLSLTCGVATIVYPLVFHFPFLLFFIFACIGYATVLLNFANMNTR